MVLSEELVQQVWEKARGFSDRDSTEWRQDECGAWLRRDAYENEQSEFGWTVVNTSPGDPDTLENLRPLHCKNSFDRANEKAHCHVSADREGLQAGGVIGQPGNKFE